MTDTLLEQNQSIWYWLNLFGRVAHFDRTDGSKPSRLFIAADKEELSVFNGMGEVIIGSVAHIGKIYSAGSAFPDGIDHMAESGVFVHLSAGLNHEVSEPAVKDGIKGIDMDLMGVSCGFAVRFKESVGIIRIAEDVNGRPDTGNELIFTIIKVLLQPAVKGVEKVGEGGAGKLASLSVKSNFGRGKRGTAEITVKFLFDTVRLHSEEHHQETFFWRYPIYRESARFPRNRSSRTK